MQQNRLRERMTRSGMPLPVMLVLSGALWLALSGWLFSYAGAAAFGWAATLATTYVVMEWANTNALLRIHSRLITVVFLALLTAFPFLHLWSADAIPPLCLALAYVFFFQMYQRPDAAADAFHTFFFLGVGSLLFPGMLFLVPAFLLSLSAQLRALSWRTFVAGLLGLLTPYWIWLAWAVWDGGVHALLAELLTRFRLVVPSYDAITVAQMVSAIFVGVYAVSATFHFVRTAFNDKIRTRMYFYSLIVAEVFLAAMFFLLPQHFDVTLRCFTICAAPLIAHHFAFSRGRLVNAWFVFTLFALAALCGFNYYWIWIH